MIQIYEYQMSLFSITEALIAGSDNKSLYNKPKSAIYKRMLAN